VRAASVVDLLGHVAFSNIGADPLTVDFEVAYRSSIAGSAGAGLDSARAAVRVLMSTTDLFPELDGVVLDVFRVAPPEFFVTNESSLHLEGTLAPGATGVLGIRVLAEGAAEASGTATVVGPPTWLLFTSGVVTIAMAAGRRTRGRYALRMMKRVALFLGGLALYGPLFDGLALPVGGLAQTDSRSPAEYKRSGEAHRVGTDERLVITLQDGRLSVRILGVPLREVLQAIARRTSVPIFVDPAVEATVVAAFEGVPVDEALRRLLREQSFVFDYRRAESLGASELTQVRVYPPGTRVSPGAQRATTSGEPVSDNRPRELTAEAAGASDPADRKGAVEALHEDSDDRRRQLTVEALGASDPAARKRAVEELHDSREAEAIPTLVMALNDVDAEVRVKALLALQELGIATAMQALAPEPFVEAVKSDPDPGVRRAALDVVGALADESQNQEAIAAIEHARHDPDPHIRQLAEDLVAERLKRMEGDPGAPLAADPPIPHQSKRGNP